MKKCTCLTLALFAFFSFVFGQTVTLEEALRRQWVSATISMKPDHNLMSSIEVSLKNLRKEGISIVIPVGFIFQAADSTVQDFIHLEKREMPIAPLSTNALRVKAMCIRAHRRSPSDNTVFLPKTVASGHLLALTSFAFEQKLHDTDAMQSALWAITDGKDLVGIDNLTLAKFVAFQLNKPLPDYFVNYKLRNVAGQTAYTALEPLEINGVFRYTLPSDQVVKLDLVDSTGRSVLKNYNLVETMNQTKGKHRFTFSMELKEVARGTYFVKIMSVGGEKEWATKTVVF
jgi:hypothetical protein